MAWLNVPHLQQRKLAWCLPAYIAMVSAYWEQPLYQEDIARWLGTTDIGTPSVRIQRLHQYGFQVDYGEGSLANLAISLSDRYPAILFVRTGDLPYWTIDTPHAIVLAGLTAETAFVFDPWLASVPARVTPDEQLLAWSHFDYTCAVLRPQD